MRSFKAWILENMTPYNVLGPGMDGINDPTYTLDTVNSKYYGKGNVADKKSKIKMANFERNKTIKRK